MTTPQQVGHKTVAMATLVSYQPSHKICNFMIEYIKNAKAYKLQNRHISSRCGPGHKTQFGESRSKI